MEAPPAGRVDLTVSMPSPNDWATTLPKLIFYAEEADVRFDVPDARPAYDDLGAIVGTRLRVPAANAARLHDIVTKAGLGVSLSIRPVPSHKDTEEMKVRKSLYTGGDTRGKPRDPTDRPLPSDHPNYTLTREVNIEWLKNEGRRTTVTDTD